MTNSCKKKNKKNTYVNCYLDKKHKLLKNKIPNGYM